MNGPLPQLEALVPRVEHSEDTTHPFWSHRKSKGSHYSWAHQPPSLSQCPEFLLFSNPQRYHFILPYYFITLGHLESSTMSLGRIWTHTNYHLIKVFCYSHLCWHFFLPKTSLHCSPHPLLLPDFKFHRERPFCYSCYILWNSKHRNSQPLHLRVQISFSSPSKFLLMHKNKNFIFAPTECKYCHSNACDEK
jgi:hypothetical protein